MVLSQDLFFYNNLGIDNVCHFEIIMHSTTFCKWFCCIRSAVECNWFPYSISAIAKRISEEK